MKDSQTVMLEHLDSVIESFSGINYSNFVGISAFTAAAMAAIERVAGKESVYARQLDLLSDKGFHRGFPIKPEAHSQCLYGIVQTLRDDVANGRLASFREMIHGETFGDFLEMADHLLDEGYKDAAAVIAGGALEAHLRQLCVKHGIDIEFDKSDGGRKAKKAEGLNSELASAEAYSTLDQKNVTAWLDLRNKAAHAKYDEYTKDQVALFIQSLRDFLVRHPA